MLAHVPVIPALRKWKMKDQEFKVILDYTARKIERVETGRDIKNG